MRSTCVHIGLTTSGCIVTRLRALMLLQLLITSVVLPMMDSMILIAHMTQSYLLSSPL